MVLVGQASFQANSAPKPNNCENNNNNQVQQQQSNSERSLTDDNETVSCFARVRHFFQTCLAKTLFCVWFYIANLFLNALLITIIHERVPVQVLPLPDILFDFLPYWHDGIYLVEYYISLLNLMVITLILLHRTGYRIAQRYCIIAGITYFLRAITISVTQFPVAGNRFICEPKMAPNISLEVYIRTITVRSLSYVTTLGSELMTNEHYCGDYLYSGHTVNIVLGYSFLSTYLMPPEVKSNSLFWFICNASLFLTSIISVLLLLISRSHYMVDIIFAYYVSTRTFYVYHTVSTHASLHYASIGNYFTRFWWWPLFIYLEASNQDRIAVVNRFHNPVKLIKNMFIR